MRGRLGSSLEDAATKRIKKNKKTTVTLVMGKNVITNLTLLIAERR